uniref:Uncharacterized protein n=1 Tax=Triticum urartu TaxID=4572 RepID=A0A8R7UB68_TRIUA
MRRGAEVEICDRAYADMLMLGGAGAPSGASGRCSCAPASDPDITCRRRRGFSVCCSVSSGATTPCRIYTTAGRQGVSVARVAPVMSQRDCWQAVLILKIIFGQVGLIHVLCCCRSS